MLQENPAVAAAARTIVRGGLVAFPTETVYGLGADATSDAAVAAVFQAKGRPSFNPLIVHFADADRAAAAVNFNKTADMLARAFWPGPLSMVLERRRDCQLSRLASAGLPSVAVRVPGHPLAEALLKAANTPIAAPSANRSGQISPTTAGHVRADLGDAVDMVLDGGACAVGLESSVVDLTAPTPALLRPGGISREDLEAVIGTLDVADGSPDRPRSPGMLERHYAPAAALRLNAQSAEAGEVLLAFGPGVDPRHANLSPGGDLVEAAANLFAMLHKLDRPGVGAIAVMAIPETGLGAAINDRLRRAVFRP